MKKLFLVLRSASYLMFALFCSQNLLGNVRHLSIPVFCQSIEAKEKMYELMHLKSNVLLDVSKESIDSFFTNHSEGFDFVQKSCTELLRRHGMTFGGLYGVAAADPDSENKPKFGLKIFKQIKLLSNEEQKALDQKELYQSETENHKLKLTEADLYDYTDPAVQEVNEINPLNDFSKRLQIRDMRLVPVKTVVYPYAYMGTTVLATCGTILAAYGTAVAATVTLSVLTLTGVGVASPILYFFGRLDIARNITRHALLIPAWVIIVPFKASTYSYIFRTLGHGFRTLRGG